MERLDCEYHLKPGEGRFESKIGRATGPVDLGAATLQELRNLEIERGSCYGNRLFDRLFPPGPLLAEYQSAETHANALDMELRFRLYLDPTLDPKVLDLAWERLERRGAGRLALSAKVAFSRFLPANPGPPPVLTGRPRVLAAVADPVDLTQHHLRELDGKRLGRALAKALAAKMDCKLLQEPITLPDLQKALQPGTFQVLHLVAHGLPPVHGEGGVVLAQRRGLAALVKDDQLVEILANSPGLRLVVLVACHSGAVREVPFLGLAEGLVQRGIPAVVAMHHEISLAAAEVFTKAFYAKLAQSGEVDVAANKARLRLFASTDKVDDWSNVILLTSLEEGKIWQVAEPEPPPPPPPRHHPPPRLTSRLLRSLLVLLFSLFTGSAPRPQASEPTGSSAPTHSAPSGSSSTQPLPTGDHSLRRGTLTEPTTRNKPIESTACFSTIPEADREKILAAQSFRHLGGSENIEESYRRYKEAFDAVALSPATSGCLDQTSLTEEERKVIGSSHPDREAAVRIFGRLLDPVAGTPYDNP